MTVHTWAQCWHTTVAPRPSSHKLPSDSPQHRHYTLTLHAPISLCHPLYQPTPPTCMPLVTLLLLLPQLAITIHSPMLSLLHLAFVRQNTFFSLVLFNASSVFCYEWRAGLWHLDANWNLTKRATVVDIWMPSLLWLRWWKPRFPETWLSNHL